MTPADQFWAAYFKLALAVLSLLSLLMAAISNTRNLLAAVLLLVTGASPLWAQRIKVEAVAGEPFGVGRVVIPLRSYIDPEKVDAYFMSIRDREGRVMYPALRYTQPMGMVRELLGMPQEGAPSQLHLHFLFKGTAPLQLELNVPERLEITAVPNGRPAAYRRLLRAWWVRYKSAARTQRREGDYYPVVETYLTNMLSRRLGLASDIREEYDTGESLLILLGLEKIRLGILQESIHGGPPRNEPLEHPLPSEINWPQPTIPAFNKDNVQTESIAGYVPEECFYIRFAQFSNYVWLRRLLEEYGGDLSRMVMLRGTDSQLNQQVEEQLGLSETSLSRMLGPKVISDIAMIGSDTFLREGAAIGILFEAKSNLLKTELQNQRTRRVQELRDADAKTEIIEINGTKVSFARTPDNRLRSFQAYHGNYHLVTNCRAMVERFLECAQGKRTLASSEEFQYARSLNPIGEDNALFVYLSRRFFEELLSPQYQIELRRRLRSVTDIELLDVATRAAIAEGWSNEPITIDRLVAEGFLGHRVDLRSDGSFTKVVNGQAHDSLRGSRGTFLPIPDTPIGKITQSEARAFRRTAEFHRRNWTEMDPVLIGLTRSALNDEVERVEVQARMLPLNKDKYGMFTRYFGPPTKNRIKNLEDDIISVQAFVDGRSLGVPSHHLYFGIRDAASEKDYSQRRFLKSLQILRTAPAYVAAWPRPGFLDSFGLGGRPVGDGYRKMLLGLYRLDGLNGFSFLSFNPQIMSEVNPQMSIEEAAEPAQLHVHVGDIMNSNFGKWANELDFQRAWETSVGNVHLLHVLTQQLKVPMADAKEAAESLLDAKLICPFGGEYQLVQNPDGTQRWASSAWATGKEAAKEGYVSPLMHWLRGLQASMTIEEDRVVAGGWVDIQREKQESGGGIRLPLFDFFGRGKKSTGSEANPASKQPPAESPSAQAEELPPPEPTPER